MQVGVKKHKIEKKKKPPNNSDGTVKILAEGKWDQTG